MFDSLVEKYSFPVPEPSYNATHPLRIYSIDGYYHRVDHENDPETFNDFDASLFWINQVERRAGLS